MSDGNSRVLRPGHRIALGRDVFTVIQLNGTNVTLQDQHGELSAMLLGYLLTAPGFEALDAAPPKRAPQDGRLSILDETEQRRIRWLEGHLIELETGRHPEGPPRADYDPYLHTADERELAKLAELKAAGTEMSQRHLQRLRHSYRYDGLIGLADKRALRSQTPGNGTDSRVIVAIEEMLAEPRGRSTVARSVMLTQLQRKLDDDYGPGEVPMPSRATLYRLMSHMDRGRRNFVSEASRRTSVNRPERPFTPVTALRPGEDVPIDTNKLDIMLGDPARAATQHRRAVRQRGGQARHHSRDDQLRPRPGLPFRDVPASLCVTRHIRAASTAVHRQRQKHCRADV